MTARDLTATTALVTGASRGFGRATAVALAERGAHVVGVARTRPLLDELAADLGGRLTPVAADVTEPGLAARLLAEHRPQTLVLNAGATPPPAPLSEQSWAEFATNWDVDVRHAFHFLQEALRLPLPEGSLVVSMSSGAALWGSPLSGSYARAKAMIRQLSGYAGVEAEQRALGIRFAAVLPVLTPATDLGRLYTGRYAALAGVSEAEFVERFGGELTTEVAAKAITELVVDDSLDAAAYELTPGGLQALR